MGNPWNIRAVHIGLSQTPIQPHEVLTPPKFPHGTRFDPLNDAAVRL